MSLHDHQYGNWKPKRIERISQAEALAKEGKKVDEIISMTGLARVTAQCIVGRVRGELDFSSLMKFSEHQDVNASARAEMRLTGGSR